MQKLGYLLVLVAVIAAALLAVRWLNGKRDRRRLLLRKQRFDAETRAQIAEDFVLYGRLPVATRDELDGLMHVFISEKGFEACGGLESVTPHMQRVIAAQACLLLLGINHNYYEKLRTILLYPGAYKAEGMHGAEDVRLGESWGTGSVVLSWNSVVAGGRNPEDGHDVAIHEFAHQLDQRDGAGDGVPVLSSTGLYREWAAVFRPAFEQLQARVEKGKRGVMDDYGAENPAEFFAVATETFYEKPEQLAKAYPDLFEQLRKYYGVDPREWLD
ncbi:hypothetical protein SAMN02745181_0957 [Rubritalea squalenifaciens DSM 18772]|uniref:Zinc-dependent peptidase n=1 Tax=Rubritalea squalenifaciens DSM 18772 TaxID=1123071 RepID=A0A1M6E7N2_9BACT|nr:M90 family metallopeptidase [Rubritalea squalenifaciens]SHI81445.1 hypothetical protein SAMN02745181_0957 [Rubritalea squalenifaciens DSM 18772]